MIAIAMVGSMAYGATSTGPSINGQVIDVLLTARRDANAARRFFIRALAALAGYRTESD